MPTKANGPLQEDYRRAMRAAVRAAREAGAKLVRVEVGGCAIVIPLDEAAEAKVVGGQFEPKRTIAPPQW
jgi:methylmalonyl-CoA mutase cobalamin-binding subunit